MHPSLIPRLRILVAAAAQLSLAVIRTWLDGTCIKRGGFTGASENAGEKIYSSSLCSTGQDQHLSTFSNGQVETAGNRLQRFLPAFLISFCEM